MSSLKNFEKKYFENLFEMRSGYVLDFSDRTFADFFADYDVSIHSERYQKNGTSKAKKLRAFWEIDDDQLVGRVLEALLSRALESAKRRELAIEEEKSEEISGARKAISRLLEGAEGGGRSSLLYLGSLTVKISNVPFRDFLLQRGGSNSLSQFHHDLADLQLRLEGFPDVEVQLERPSTEEYLTLKDFTISDVAYSDGSVVAKIKLSCQVVLGVTTFLAAYPTAKQGFVELRSDLQSVSREIFSEYLGSSDVPSKESASQVRYYFIKPETAEENLRKLVAQKS